MAIILPGDEERTPKPTPGDLPGTTATTPAPTAPMDNRAGITALYQQMRKGANPSESDIFSWIGNNNWEQGIKNSPEWKAYEAGQSYTPTYNQMPGWNQDKLNDPNKHNPKYDWGRVVQQHPDWLTSTSLPQLVQFFNMQTGGKATVVGGDRVDFADGYGPIDVIQASHTSTPTAWWGPTQGQTGTTGTATGTSSMTGSLPGTTTGTAGTTGTTGTTTGAGSVASGSVFSDPATTEWESLLRQFVDKLNVPQATWSPSQMELQQTQALDPLERQRQQYRQQATAQLASRGIGPGSGIFDSTMRDIDRQFQQQETQTRAGFATQAINREDQVFQNNETRAGNAVNIMGQIPKLADSRLATAQGTINQINPAQLLTLQQQMQQQAQQQAQLQQQQQQAFWAQLIAAISQAFG